MHFLKTSGFCNVISRRKKVLSKKTNYRLREILFFMSTRNSYKNMNLFVKRQVCECVCILQWNEMKSWIHEFTLHRYMQIIWILALHGKFQIHQNRQANTNSLFISHSTFSSLHLLPISHIS